jgi:hypothetical protein
VHSERSGKLTDAPPDPSIADDADRGAIKITQGKLAAICPPPLPDQFGRRPLSLDQMQGQREHALGHGSCSAARCNHDRNASCRGRLEIHVVDTNTGAREDAQPWGAREKRGIDDRVGTDDRADCIGDVRFAWIGDKRNFIAEDAGD